MREVCVVEHENGWKGTWYHSGMIIQVEDFDAKPPHLLGFYQQIDSTNTIKKDHCFVLVDNLSNPSKSKEEQ